MRRTIIFYGVTLALLVVLLKWLEYRLWIRELSISHYVGMVAVVFTIVGVWAGRKLTKVSTPHQSANPNDLGNLEEKLKQLGISRRELDVLELMARGYSNQEIADKLFISLNTVKTHSSNLFLKLNAKRRTQAIETARQEGLVS